ncbi:MAG: 2-oxoacid:acceptor oxidoreductase [Candidatus Muiribacterium halophilum]|uniref:2-oxoacid:acceptor oxidoreductase n=1 Tax=Muiribacterium halophilum TaxID=2053465 RepID=A0A2N5ZC15_MUIH1|nr:MAG: 2-oxoacid:acceptor oxidoreductase [Candidatus Muirbacterium halophilum]
MAKIKIAEEFCKECGLCVEACPKKILEISNRLNTKGYKVVQITDMDSCIGCGACAKVCPDIVISVYKD